MVRPTILSGGEVTKMGFEMSEYLQTGIVSGWTSGFLSGYGCVGISNFTSGGVALRTEPLSLSSGCGRMIVIRHDGQNGVVITDWESSVSETARENTEKIVHWLFRG